jgi:undecaprenyl-diphosphatase
MTSIDRTADFPLFPYMPELLKAAILGIVEGLTEFLPVSSTGHLIIASEILNYENASSDTFSVFIQLGAILAVLVHFRHRFLGLLPWRASAGFAGSRGLFYLFLTTLPAVVIGLLAHGIIKEHLFSVKAVAIGLAVGAAWILLTETFYRHNNPTGLDNLTWVVALGIGVFQCLAMWPGMSRSACTILGAMLLGLRRRDAAEYSFFAAAPMMLAATTYDLYSNWEQLSMTDVPLFAVGFATAFVSALAAVSFLISFISRHTFSAFAWYRLLVAAGIALWLMADG